MAGAASLAYRMLYLISADGIQALPKQLAPHG